LHHDYVSVILCTNFIFIALTTSAVRCPVSESVN